jgi:hypothetical protein
VVLLCVLSRASQWKISTVDMENCWILKCLEVYLRHGHVYWQHYMLMRNTQTMTIVTKWQHDDLLCYVVLIISTTYHHHITALPVSETLSCQEKNLVSIGTLCNYFI